MAESNVTLQDILRTPDACCRQHWGDTGTEHMLRLAEVQHLIAIIEQTRPELKRIKSEKQKCARDFGKAKTTGENLDNLKAHMQKISAQLAQLEQQQRDVEAALLQLFKPMAEAPAIPPRFADCAPRAGGDVTIAALPDAADGQAWDAYVAAHPQASPYHTYRWRAVITASFGHESFYLTACDDSGQLRGVLPLVRLRSRLFGDFAVSVAFFNYGGPLADSPAITRQLLDAAGAMARSLQLQHMEIRATRQLLDWPTRTDKVSMILRLPASGEQLDRQIGAKVRAQIKRARQSEVTTRRGGLELFDDFYRVFAINMRDLGTPVYGRNFFASILREFAETARLVVVYLRGRPVATAFLLGYRDMLEIPWASTLRSVNALNLNMLLYREVLELAIEQGYAFFDFGRSSLDSGTYRFKKQWGAAPVQHYWHYWLPAGGALPELKPDSPKFRLLVSCWQHLPVALTRLIGPNIVKYLP